MQRVCVIGSSGSGKSTLARRLGEVTGLPVEHLDRHSWLPGWVERPREEMPGLVARLAQGERWIIDGNYSATLPSRLARADTVIFLDYPRSYCLGQAIRRYFRNRGGTRPCITEGCPEKIDLEFVGWIWGYPRRSRPKVLRLLSEWLGVDGSELARRSEYMAETSGMTRRFIHFKRRADSERWLRELRLATVTT